MNKKEHRKNFNNPTVYKISNEGLSGVIEFIAPNNKEDLEKMAAQELLWHFSNNLNSNSKICYSGDHLKNEPDFLVSINNNNFGLEVTEIISEREHIIDILNKEYQFVLQNKIDKTLRFAFTGIEGKKLAKTTSIKGVELCQKLIVYISESIKSKILDKNTSVLMGQVDGLQFCVSFVPLISHIKILDEDYIHYKNKLEKKYKNNYSTEEKTILLVYRTGSFVKVEQLKKIIDDLNTIYGFRFFEIWYICIKPENTSWIERLY